jgi:putative FmdB family regulatory protein
VPLYEYQCVKCKRRTEKIERVAGPHLRKCPHCGAKVERLQSAPAIQFKGSGWYVTDYAGKSGGKESPAEKADTAEKADKADKTEKGETKETPKDTGAKETKENKEKKAEKKKN